MYKVAFRLILPRLGLLRSDLKPRVRCVYIMSESPVIHSFSLLRKNRTGLVCSRRSNLLRLAGEEAAAWNQLWLTICARDELRRLP